MEHSLPGLGRAPEKGAVDYPDPIYPDEAAHALAIFKQLRLWMHLVALRSGSPVHRGCLPGGGPVWLLRCADRCTPYQGVFILIPKKNSKSTLAAGIMRLHCY